ncbi:MAG: TonB-dependent receptor, partial [Balneolaceae bacterium]
MKFSFVVLLVSCLFHSVHSHYTDQTDYILSGYVFEENSGNPLHGATVYIVELERGTTTGEDGYYSISLPAGYYTVRIQYLGMETAEQEVTITGNIQLDFSLTELDLDLDEIIVEGIGFGDHIRGAITGVEVVSIRDLEQLPMLMGEIDVVRSLVALPGVQTVGEGASGFNVRGGREDQNLVLMDGAPLFNSSHVLGLFSVFNPDVTDGYALYKGHMPERFGGRVSSVLDVSMRSGSAQDFKVHGGIGFYSARLMVEGPIVKDRTSFLVSGRGADSSVLFLLAGKDRDMMRISLPLDVYNSRAWFYDGNANITHRINPYNRLSLSMYGSSDYFRYSDEFGYSWQNRIATMKWTSAFSDHFFSETTVAANHYRSSYFTPEGAEAFRLNTGIGYTRASQQLLYTGYSRQTWNAGAEWTRYRSDDEELNPYDELSAIAADETAKDSGREMAAFIGNEIEISDRLLVSIGLRYSVFQQLGPGLEFSYADGVPRTVNAITDTTRFNPGKIMAAFHGFEPRLSSRLMLNEESSVKLSYNRARQYVHQVSNSTSPTPADIWQVSTRYLPPQISDNFSIGYFRSFWNTEWEASVDFYYRNVHDLVEYIDFARLFLNSHIETDLISARGRAYGSELNIRKNSGNWTGWLSYTLGRTYVKADDDFPERSVNRGEWFPSNYDQPHNVNLVGVRRLGENSAFSFNFTWRSGRPITAISSNYTDHDTTVPVFARRNSERIPDYIRLDISFSIADNIWAHWEPSPNRR